MMSENASSMKVYPVGSLRSALDYSPVELQFGTSGRRGDVVDLTQLEIYINASAELEYLQSLPISEGGVVKGEEFYFAYDLRPSSTELVPEEAGRGEIAQAVELAIHDAEMTPVNLGLIPTPALMAYALTRGRGSIMVTGSHIPFERNGYKTNTSRGELLKKDEAPIGARVAAVRERIYALPYAESSFDRRGMLKAGNRALAPEDSSARAAYLQRYADFFEGLSLTGKRILVYQHSAVGRDLLVELLKLLGAEVIAAGRSDTFVPIDTENIDDAQLAVIQQLADRARMAHGPLDVVVSIDGDSDRPLVLGVESDGKVRFFGGDLVGMVVAEYLGADAVVVPISCNDAIDRGALKDRVQPKTRIGSPYVIAGMEAATAQGKKAVCGWEANGGFLVGSEIARNGRLLAALPTRDAFLPILASLFAAHEHGVPLVELFDRLPKRYSKAALLKRFPKAVSREIVRQFSPSDGRIIDVSFAGDGVSATDSSGESLAISGQETNHLSIVRSRLRDLFTIAEGIGGIERLNYTDGVRIVFETGEIAHVRPSGNADELRIYAVADSQARAEEIARLGIAEPDGVLRRMAREAVVSRFIERPAVVKLEGKIQRYDWGGEEFIAGLLGVDNSAREPNAELWIGAHAGAPSSAAIDGVPVALGELIAASPDAVLGPAVAARFDGRLPYLFKILDARKMLSIQAHPTKHQAEEGFSRENAAGIDLKAPNRNYRDDNHKPEVHAALTDFWMLHGFRPLEAIDETLRGVTEFASLMPEFSERLAAAGSKPEARSALLRDLYADVMTMPQERIDSLLDPLIARLRRTPNGDKDSADFWALRAADDFPLPGGHRDRGIVSIYLLNLLRLRPGQGTYQPAGTLHAYLEGTNVELMANSDNVLRGGLTPKNVDVRELLRILDFTDGKPAILAGETVTGTERVYRTPAPEFELSAIHNGAGKAHTGKAVHGPDSLIVLEGSVTIASGETTLELKRGEIAFAPFGVEYRIDSREPSIIYRATVPASS